MKKDSIYLNENLSNHYGVPYINDEKTASIDADKLKEDGDGTNRIISWDSEHKEIFDKYKGKTLGLIGSGYGWWIIDWTL